MMKKSCCDRIRLLRGRTRRCRLRGIREINIWAYNIIEKSILFGNHEHFTSFDNSFLRESTETHYAVLGNWISSQSRIEVLKNDNPMSLQIDCGKSPT